MMEMSGALVSCKVDGDVFQNTFVFAGINFNLHCSYNTRTHLLAIVLSSSRIVTFDGLMRILFGGVMKPHQKRVITEERLDHGNNHSWMIHDFKRQGRQIIIDLEFTRLSIDVGQQVVVLVEQNHDIFRKLEDDGNVSVYNNFFYSMEHVGSMVRNLYETDDYKDFTLIHADGNIRVHKAVLAGSSTTLSNMLQDVAPANSLDLVVVPGYHFQHWVALIMFMYGVLNDDDLHTHRLSLVILAQLLEVKNLVQLCESSLKSDINTGNVLERFEFAERFHLSGLGLSCLSYLRKKVYDIPSQQLLQFYRGASKMLKFDLKVSFGREEELVELLKFDTNELI